MELQRLSGKMGATLEGGAAGYGTAKDVNLGKPSSSVASKQLDGGAEGSTCGICSAVVQTRGLLDCCNHLFCFSCITEWFTVSNLCPLCKSRSRFITPQMFSTETGLWEKLESDSALSSRDGMPNVQHGEAVSFPPYFIDEEAVLCLEGDRCLVRAGVLDLDAEGNAAADTSVACDLCDCWYHGGCVGFKPDQTSFVCPRCLASREADRVAAAEPALPMVASWQQTSASTIPEPQSVRGDQLVFSSSTSMAVEEPEEGESHVSISLRRFPSMQQPVEPHRNVETQPNTHSAEREIMWSPIREAVPVQSYGPGWPPGLEQVFTGVKPLSNKFLPPKLETVKKIPLFQEEVWSPTREPAATPTPRVEDQLWSPTPETSREWSCTGVQHKLTAPSAYGLESGNPQRRESRVTVNKNGALRQVEIPRSDILSRSARIDTFSGISSKTATVAEDARRSPNFSATRAAAYPPGSVKEEIGIDVDRLQLAVEQLRKGKRKALQEDERNIDVRDLPEMPRKIARKSERKVDVTAVKATVSRKDLIKTTKDQVPEKRTLEAVNSVQKRRMVDQTSLAASNGVKRMGADVFPCKDKRKMIADVVRRNNTNDQVSEKRTEVAVNSLMKGGSVDRKAGATDIGENRLGVDVLPPKDETTMTADALTRSEEQKKTADVSVNMEEQKRPVANVTSNMEEEKATVASVTVKMEEQKETVAHITSKIEEQKKTVVDVTTAKTEEQKTVTQVVTEPSVSYPIPELSGDVPVQAQPSEVEPQTSTPQPEPLDDPMRTEATEVDEQISTPEPASSVNIPKAEAIEVDQLISIPQRESFGDAPVRAEISDVGQRMNSPPPETLGDTPVKAEFTEISCQAQPSNLEEPSVKNPEPGSEVDLIDIVKESRYGTSTAGSPPGPSKGVRTRIIMHREQDMNDGSRPSLVERIRQQMRETAGYGAGEDLGKVDVSDDRFIAAFKAAQARSNEKCGELMKPGSSKAQSSGRLWKVLDKKYSATGTRDNLIRKLYAGGGRKCWDRDWDIAFWRERDPNQRKARKEAEEGKNSFVKEAESDPEDAEFLDRVYIADTSLFPRNEDVKPLSVQGNQAEGAAATEPERNGARKVTPRQFDKGSKAAAGVKDDSCKGVDPLQSILVKNLKAPAVATEKPLSASASAKVAKPQGTLSAADKQQGENAGASAGTSDVKKDKRQWALEILARKEGRLGTSSSTAKTGGGASGSKDNPFELLLQLPVEMRPLLLGDTRRNKIPPGARQVQLNRLVEQELKRANLAVIGHNVESIEAVARAVAREEELCKSSNSKGVYLNRCVRALANTDYEVKVTEDTATVGDQETAEATIEESPKAEIDEAVRKALEDTGLVDSPTSEPVAEHDQPDKEDPETAPQNPVQKIWPENVLEVENITEMNIGTEISLSRDDDFSGDPAKGSSEKKSMGVSAVSSISSGGQAKPAALTVVLKACSRQHEAAAEQEEGKRLKEDGGHKLVEDGREGTPLYRVDGSEVSTDPSEGAGCAPGIDASYDDADDMYDGLELNLNPVVSSEVMAQLNAEPNPLFPERQTRENEEDPSTVSTARRAENGGLSTSDAAPLESAADDDCLKFADIDRRIENIRRNKALNGDSGRSKKSKGRAHGDATKTNVTSVQMQVEIYVNQHLKPLYRSQVITAEQFKWTVTKTAAKVMEHHQNALNADFLISEGSKVKKLADQYLRAFAQRKA